MVDSTSDDKPSIPRLVIFAHHHPDEQVRIDSGARLVGFWAKSSDYKALIKASEDTELHPAVREAAIDALPEAILSLPGLDKDPEPFYDCAQNERLPERARLDLGILLVGYLSGVQDIKTMSKVAKDPLFHDQVRSMAGISLIEVHLDTVGEEAVWDMVGDEKLPYGIRMSALEAVSELAIDRGDFDMLASRSERDYPLSIKMYLSEAADKAASMALQLASESERPSLLDRFERDTRLSDRPPGFDSGSEADGNIIDANKLDMSTIERVSSLTTRTLTGRHLDDIRAFTSKPLTNQVDAVSPGGSKGKAKR